MALNDIYRVKVHIAYDAAGTVMMQNTFYYEETLNIPGNDDSTELAAQFKVNVFPRIQNVIHVDGRILAFSVENVIPGPDNVYESYGLTEYLGARTGDKAPPFQVWAFRLNRTTTDIRNGQKRFGPMSETDQTAGVATGTVIAELGLLSSAMQANLGTIGVTSVYTPRIFRPASPAITIPAKTYPAKLQRVRPIGDVTYVRVSTQNSRKFGHGS